MASTDEEGLQAELDYEDLQNETILEAEELETIPEEPLIELQDDAEEQDFHNPLKSQAAATSSVEPHAESEELQSSLRGNTDSQDDVLTVQGNDQAVDPEPTTVSLVGSVNYQLPSRKNLARKLKQATVQTLNAVTGPLVSLKRLMSRPPGTAFYGAKATIIKGWIQSMDGSKRPLTFDSGSEITLIDEGIINELDPPPRIKTGQKLKLIQVTGNSTISRYVVVPLFFETKEGPVEMIVEAYVVPKMNAPFIIGTDFASQYSLSLIRDENGTRIQFGPTGRSTPVEVSDTDPRIDKSGISFKVEVTPDFIQNMDKATSSKKKYKKKKKNQDVPEEATKVRIYETVTIAPKSIKLVKLDAHFKEGQETGFIDRAFDSMKKEEDISRFDSKKDIFLDICTIQTLTYPRKLT
ncbi:hypothetical protein FS749_006770 [Ceratobasidium sp. UAMH 11750]|nr:hypothetical protein FS749_006770 [Ceratobasidium sp. UAMH 11750]